MDFSDGKYRTKHPSWDLELLSYMFNVTNRRTLQSREQILRDAADLLFKFENPDLSKSIISATYDTARLETEEGKRVPIEVIENTIEIPKNLDDKSKYDIFTYSIGSVYSDLKKYDEAIESYDKAIEIDPQFSSAWHNRGAFLADQGKYEEAVKSYDKAIEIDPQFSSAWHNRGNVLDSQGKYEEL